MSELNQSNKPSTSGNHLHACGCRQKETVRVDFCQEIFTFSIHYPFLNVFFVGTRLSLINATLLRTLCHFLSGLFTMRVYDVVMNLGCCGANAGCLVGGARSLMGSKCSAERCILCMTGDEALQLRRTPDRSCPGPLISRCGFVWEHVGAAWLNLTDLEKVQGGKVLMLLTTQDQQQQLRASFFVCFLVVLPPLFLHQQFWKLFVHVLSMSVH